MKPQKKLPGRIVHALVPLIFALLSTNTTTTFAQTNLSVYADSLGTGWLDYSYTCTRNFANTSPVHSGSDSISVTITGGYGGLQLYHAPMNSGPYASITFWLNGGSSGGQLLQMYGNEGTGPSGQSQRVSLNTPLVNTWQQYIIPLASLGVANVTNFSGFAIQDSANSTEPTFYIDDIQLVSASAPSVTHLTVNANQTVRTADARWLGINAPVWDSILDTPQSIALLTNMGTQFIRVPGGSDADDYHWLYNRQDLNTWTWGTSLANLIQVITNVGAQAVSTLNYGTGSSNEAAAWVAYVNAATNSTVSLGTDTNGFNWQTAGYWASIRAATPLKTDDGKNFLRISRAAPVGFKYWEIGNENYGASWETDSNVVPHDPYTYAMRAKGFIALIKAVDPTAKVGVVVTPGEDGFVNNTSHPVTNPRTGQVHYGWTPVLLATLTAENVTPDFAIHHRYPQNPGNESDAGLLASSTGWASDAGNLRQMISDYDAASGTNIELLCTENNSVSSGPGKQSVSLVNGLFKLDSLGQLMQTEFNSLCWWAFRNGTETDGNMSAALYGWRQYGDYGVVSGYTDLYPTYYVSKLMTHFVGSNDTVIAAASDYSLLAGYAVRRHDGSLAVLVINKDPSNTLTGELELTGFAPNSNATCYSYGIPQDNAAETGVGSPDVAQTNISGMGTNFNYAFAPYSATVLALAPLAAKLSAATSQPVTGQFIFQFQGQPGTPYVLQRSTNLVTWTSISTNTLVTNVINLTNSAAPSSSQFWRAVWLP